MKQTPLPPNGTANRYWLEWDLYFKWSKKILQPTCKADAISAMKFGQDLARRTSFNVKFRIVAFDSKGRKVVLP